MVSPQEEESLVYDVKLSSVGPGRITGSDVFHNPSGLDLAMKLHYIKIIYFFESEVAKNLNIMKIKESSFYLFNHYFITCGRFRRSEYGRPLIKCNDCGARFIEAKCKITHFKCGGASFGLSWAHILGGPLSASDFINTWGQTMVNLCLDKSINVPRALKLNQTISDKHPICVKKVDSVGDHWILPNNIKMDTFSFLVSNPQINYLQENIWGQNDNRTPPFESICAIIWQCLAQVKGGFKPNIVTVCKTDPHRMRNDIIGNNQMIKKVEADSKYSIVNTDLRILASLLANQGIDEVSEIEKAIEKEEGIADFFVYGANLTFVDLQEINVYDLQLMGHKPRFVYYTLQGVGDEGVVLVMPCNNGSTNNCNDGKFVTIILAEDQMVKFKIELKINGLLLESDLE
ncbi:hypothetical protein TanjilG_01216 [Lupinus angustifolius]|uniref:Uncharacterized protein n=1 Tax=Lupinus angustifolius TaxID=3871 RepID=A0A1J7IXB8_LUPAN|nr:hypothetical protein TanjilG_01216 [Lupinus angustifolius]